MVALPPSLGSPVSRQSEAASQSLARIPSSRPSLLPAHTSWGNNLLSWFFLQSQDLRVSLSFSLCLCLCVSSPLSLSCLLNCFSKPARVGKLTSVLDLIALPVEWEGRKARRSLSDKPLNTGMCFAVELCSGSFYSTGNGTTNERDDRECSIHSGH